MKINVNISRIKKVTIQANIFPLFKMTRKILKQRNRALSKHVNVEAFGY